MRHHLRLLLQLHCTDLYSYVSLTFAVKVCVIVLYLTWVELSTSWFKCCGAGNRFMLQRTEIKWISFILYCHNAWHGRARATATPCVQQIVKTAVVPNAAHKSSNLQKAKYRFRSTRGTKVENSDFQTQWVVKKGKKKSFAQWQWSFHFTLSPFPDGPQESRHCSW